VLFRTYKGNKQNWSGGIPIPIMLDKQGNENCLTGIATGLAVTWP
jgi:hypothetical protein